jgi:SAM-dependent methyltransferase
MKDNFYLNIDNYFNKKAKFYSQNSESFFWSQLRNSELNGFKELIKVFKKKIFLELGSGTGFYSNFLILKGAKQVYAIDRSKKMVKNISNRKIKKLTLDASNFSLNKKFSNILCMGLLEFVESQEKVLLNAKKHSNNNSKIFILVPRDNFFGYIYKIFHKLNGISIKLYSLKDIQQLLTKTGWCLDKYVRVHYFGIIVRAKLK